MRQTVSACVFDVDNTLFDWVGSWHSAFRSQLNALVRLTGISEDVLKREFRIVHQRYGTTEYTYALEELPCLKQELFGGEFRLVCGQARHEYHRARTRSLRLYPGVMRTLSALQRRGCRLVAYTESTASHAADRFRKLGLDGVFDALYSSADGQPLGCRSRRYDSPRRALRRTEHRLVPKGATKPNAEVLRTILADIDANVATTVYVGDSRSKDIAMANSLGLASVLAAYGVPCDDQACALLREVSHWSDSDIRRELAVQAAPDSPFLQPDFVLHSTLEEVLDHFEFVAAPSQASAVA